MKKFVVVLIFLALFVSQGNSDIPSRDTEFTFARVQFTMDFRAVMDREAPWHHDYPYAEDLYLSLLREVTGVYTNNEAYQIVRLDEPDVFKYPFLYISEPGFMELTEREVRGFREYFNRGGFAIFDDFRGRDLDNLQRQMKIVFPDRNMYRLDLSHEVFHTFYDIDSLEMQPPYYDGRFQGRGVEFWGMNDEKGRLLFVANLNNDFGEFWEWVDRGEMPFQPAAKSVRLGVNYLIYAMTH